MHCEEVYEDGSVLSKEKGDIHIGCGTVPIGSVEQDEIEEVAGDFHHTDFVLKEPR